MKEERYKLVEKWVQEAQEGGQKAKEMLLSFKPLMLSMVQKYVYNPSDYEDAGRAACCAFLEGVRDFDPGLRCTSMFLSGCGWKTILKSGGRAGLTAR